MAMERRRHIGYVGSRDIALYPLDYGLLGATTHFVCKIPSAHTWLAQEGDDAGVFRRDFAREVRTRLPMR